MALLKNTEGCGVQKHRGCLLPQVAYSSRSCVKLSSIWRLNTSTFLASLARAHTCSCVFERSEHVWPPHFRVGEHFGEGVATTFSHFLTPPLHMIFV